MGCAMFLHRSCNRLLVSEAARPRVEYVWVSPLTWLGLCKLSSPLGWSLFLRPTVNKTAYRTALTRFEGAGRVYQQIMEKFSLKDGMGPSSHRTRSTSSETMDSGQCPRPAAFFDEDMVESSGPSHI